MIAEIGHPPKRTPNRFLSNPFEFAFAVVFAVIGAGLFLSRFEIRVSNVQTLPIPLVISWAFALTIGGTLIIAGLVWPGAGYIARAMERAGLYLAAGAWATYALAILSANPSSVVPISYGVTIAVACIARTVALSRVDRAIQHIAQVANRDTGE